MLNKIKVMLTSFIVMVGTFSVFIENAFAGTGDSAKQPGMSGQIIMIAVLLGGMYFLMIRPQSKRAKEHSNLLSGLVKGDQFLILIIAEGVEVTVQKQAVSFVLPKGTLKSI
jgi:preprotein translocase subunit YajC